MGSSESNLADLDPVFTVRISAIRTSGSDEELVFTVILSGRLS
jgi:hypothetical protein